MSELYCDNDHLENDYPFRWIRPARRYTLLDDEAAIKAELDQYVKPGFGTNISAISFQPSPDPFPNEDRHDIQLFELSRHPAGLTATLIILLDGHAGWETSTYAISKLPNMCREAILGLPTSAWKGDHSSSDAIAEALSSALIGLEDQMRRDFVDLFPTDLDTLKDMDQGEINKIINEDPEAHAKVLRYGQGSTALVVLRVGADVWTANIGDCEAVLGVRDSGGKSWDAKMLVDGLHNAKSNEDEKRRVEEAHPGEPDAISGEDNRLLGMIAVTRALGDGMFKLPSVYTDKVWTRLDPPMRTAAKLARLSALNVTPPYMTAVPDTLHHRIPNTAEAFLIVTSDGLTNPEYPPDDSPHTEERMWVENLGKLLDNPTRDRSNLARDLLRSTWGFGEVGRHRASAFLTLDHKEDHYQDDATVVVVIINST